MSPYETNLDETQQTRLPNGLASALGNTVPRDVRGGFYPENNPPPERGGRLAESDVMIAKQPGLQAIVEFKAPTSTSASKFVKPTGPVKLFKRVTESWGLDEGQAGKLLGYRDPRDVRDLFAGIRDLEQAQVDAVDRLKAILKSAATLHNIFRDERLVRQWLREPMKLLGGESPIDLLLKGSMRDLLRVHQYTEELAGR